MSETLQHEDGTDQLRRLLKKQVQMIRQNNLAEALILTEQAAHMIEKLQSRPGIQKEKQIDNDLIEQYKNLELILQAQMNLTQQSLQKVRNGKKTLQAYH